MNFHFHFKLEKLVGEDQWEEIEDFLAEGPTVLAAKLNAESWLRDRFVELFRSEKLKFGETIRIVNMSASGDSGEPFMFTFPSESDAMKEAFNSASNNATATKKSDPDQILKNIRVATQEELKDVDWHVCGSKQNVPEAKPVPCSMCGKTVYYVDETGPKSKFVCYKCIVPIIEQTNETEFFTSKKTLQDIQQDVRGIIFQKGKNN